MTTDVNPYGHPVIEETSVVDRVTMYVEGLDCHWITGVMD